MPRRSIAPARHSFTKGPAWSVVQSHHERDFSCRTCCITWQGLPGWPITGIWERGDKANHGRSRRQRQLDRPGQAALEALDGLDLYGPHTATAAAVCTSPSRTVMRLRRASRPCCRGVASKEVDSACLS